MSKSFITAALAAAYPADESSEVGVGCRVADPAVFADHLDRLGRPLAELVPNSAEAKTVAGLIKHSTAHPHLPPTDFTEPCDPCERLAKTLPDVTEADCVHEPAPLGNAFDAACGGEGQHAEE